MKDSPAIAALLEQSEFSCLQRIGGNFWEPVTEFSANMLAGNPSGEGLQEQLDVMVEGITAPSMACAIPPVLPYGYKL